uniref:Uncharacterized protein n=1 Tax=Arundo donax TaxID=35708 RepID=A0A0A9GP36_ARUDO
MPSSLARRQMRKRGISVGAREEGAFECGSVVFDHGGGEVGKEGRAELGCSSE